MAKLGIFTGTSANDTTGDTLSLGAVKINSNFSEIYNALGDGTNITNSLSSITVSGLSTFTDGPVLVGSGIQTGSSKLQVSGDTFITGSVGIGTTNPITNLHVIGDGNFTGVVTAISFSGNSSSASYATTAGIATYATNAGTSTSVIGGIGSITQLEVTGISTFTNGPVLIGGGTSTGTAGQVLQITGISSGAYIGGSVGIGTTNPTESLHVVGNLKVTGTITGEVSSTVATARTSTNVIGGIASVTQLQVGPGITTVGFITATSAYIGIATVGFISATNVYVSGITTVGFITASSLQVSGITTVGFLTATNVYVSGVSTFVGNSYFSNSIGIGTTNPSSSLSVNGSMVIGTEILNMTGLSSTFTTVGINSFTVPAGVTKISAVLIGGGGAGGGGSGSGGGQGGGGGGLRYVNDFAVSEGQVFDVIVGAGGAGSTGNGGNGGDSQIVGIATAFGGKGGSTYTVGDPIGLGGTGTINIGGATGGMGGKSTLSYGAGGGGAAGYVGNGGAGGGDGAFDGAVGSGGGAGGGSRGDIDSSTYGANGGGGTGILGQSSSGSSISNGGGNGGSGGSNGVTASTVNGAAGGLYGGGGGGGDGTSDTSVNGGNGAQGVVRIIWSPSSKFSRLFPTNQVGNNINQ
jgi:hypothetical protein